MIPKPTHDPVTWQGLTDLRIFLLERGMVNEALALFKVERTRLPVEERADATISFLEHVRTCNSLTEERSAWIGVELQICLARSLYERRESEKGRLEFEKAEDLLHHWCVLSSHHAMETLTPHLEIKLFQLGLLADEDPMVYFNESVKLLEIMKVCCHASTAVCYGHATAAARELDNSGHSDPYRTRFFQLHQERELYQETVQEDIRSLLFSQRALFGDAASNLRDSAKALEWVDDFMEKNQEFNLPKELHTIHSWRRSIWTSLRDSKRLQQALVEIENLESSIPRNSGVLVGVRRQIAPSGISQVDSDPKSELAFPLDLDEDNFLVAWSGVHGDYDATRRKAMELLLQWLLADLQSGVIQRDEVHHLTDLTDVTDEAKDNKALTQKLEALSFDAIFAKIYLQNADPAQVIELDVWENRFLLLKTWLSRPSKSARNGRQYLMSVLQEIRKDSVARSNVPLNVKILEIERCFSVLDGLPPKVKEFVAMKAPIWYNNIAARYWNFCAESPNFDSEEVGEALNKAEPACRHSIRLNQEKGDQVAVAMVWKMAATMSVWKLHWLLRRPGKSMSDPDLLELQQTGLGFLEKAESFFEYRHQSSTWANDLEGLEVRERVNLVGNSWELPRIAMQLLHAGNNEPDEDRRIQMWTWVQRSKARSLAMTMGVAGIIPSTLLKEISASEKCRLLYEKMISLQQQVKSAEPQKRFWLRRELDSHIAEMRKEELLRETCDLWDGKPLSFRDIDRITAIANTPLLFVDWFHVPGVMDDGKILLLTAKSGSAPTVTTLNTTIADVAHWVSFYLDRPFVRERKTSLLRDLVQPLTAQTQPEEILIFCPTSVMHRIPLHAIPVESMNDSTLEPQPLIYRNPVVYSHGHSILRVCLWNAQVGAEVQMPLNPLIMHGIPESTTNNTYLGGRESVKKLALSFSTEAFLDENATKSKFIEAAPTSRLIHVHSHVNWDSSDPLLHNIAFSASNNLHARDIFSLSVPKGSHISLIACSGGRIRNEPTDEVLGLVPALLRSGASSTISTLWKIPDQAGARFTEAFYEAFSQQKKDVPRAGGFVDMARVYQSAVKAQDDPKNHWASFVIHGFWSFFVPEQDMLPLSPNVD